MGDHRDDVAWRRAILAELPAIRGRWNRFRWALGVLRFARPDGHRWAPRLCPVLPALLTALYAQQQATAVINRGPLLGMVVVWAAVTFLGILVRGRTRPVARVARVATVTILFTGIWFVILDVGHLMGMVRANLMTPAAACTTLACMTTLTVVLPVLPFLAVLSGSPALDGGPDADLP
ncbi:MAG: hypothetical protein QG608_3131, partial [Actinomycetota bacterium]|nr:hypothetical protein [Actinomycetota bacterium]